MKSFKASARLTLFLVIHSMICIINHVKHFFLYLLYKKQFVFGFLRVGFTVALEVVLDLVHVDQAGLAITEMCLPLSLECWD